MILLPFVAHPLGAAARSERIGELRDGEDAFVAEFLAFLCAHACKQAKVVLFNRNFSAACLEFTLGAVPVQNEIRRSRTRQQRGDFGEPFPYFAGQGRDLDLQCGITIAVNDLANGNLTPQHHRKRKGVEGQQQAVVLVELVEEYETDRDELGRLAPTFGRYALDGVKTRFDCKD